MELGRIAHAGIVVSTPKARVFMDPVLFDDLEAGSLRLNPAIRVDRARLGRALPDLVVLSHEHLDHFCLRSLDLLPRSTPIAFPRGAVVIDACLEALGFEHRLQVEVGKQLTVGDLVLVPTPSRVSFPEMGMLFVHRGRSLWNLADSAIDEAIVRLVHKVTPRVDVLVAPFQPLIEDPLSVDALGAGFPYAAYGRLLRNVFDTAPRCVVPGSFGYRSNVEAWIDDRCFPMTEDRFLDDVASLGSPPARRRLAPGDVLSVSPGHRVRRGALRFVRAMRAETLAWRPDRGVPPLRDRGRPARAALVWRRVRAYLNGPLLAELAGDARRAMRQRLLAARAVWHLHVVGPARSHALALDFAAAPLRWRPPRRGEFATLHTSVTASALDGLITGSMSPYAAHCGGVLRRFVRLYEPYRGGVHDLGLRLTDPLMAILGEGATDRHLEWLLARLAGRGDGRRLER